jgi:hypothetical protein
MKERYIVSVLRIQIPIRQKRLARIQNKEKEKIMTFYVLEIVLFCHA